MAQGVKPLPILNPTKPGSKESASKASNNKPVTDVVIPKFSKMDPGQKLEIQINMAMDLVEDIEEKLEKLKDMLHRTESFDKLYPDQIAQVTSLKDNLEQLKTNALKEIARLEKAAKENKGVPEQLLPLFDQINNNCKNYIKAVKKAKRWLYRGASGPDAYIGRSWVARNPRNSEREVQEIFDEQLQKLGMTALRGNSIFATSKMGRAKQYGRVFVIFPKDRQSEFTYVNDDDLILHSMGKLPLDKRKWQSLKTNILAWCKANKKQPASAELKDIVEDLEDDINDWATWGFLEDDFMGEKQNWENKGVPSSLFPQSLAEFVSLRGFVKEYRPTNQNLDIAIQKEYEVYVYGKYYALNVAKFGKLIQRYWGINVEE